MNFSEVIRLRQNTTKGYLFPLYGTQPVQKKVQYSPTQQGSIPKIHIEDIFQQPTNPTSPVHIHHPVVTHQNQCFLVYRYFDLSTDINKPLLQLKPTTFWRGEAAVFCLGTRVSCLTAPRVRRLSWDTVARLYVLTQSRFSPSTNHVHFRWISRAVEALDRHSYPPTQIIA